MMHGDVVPEHECSGELIDVSESKYVTKAWCSNRVLLSSRFNVGPR
jgi:hypothetical protein